MGEFIMPMDVRKIFVEYFLGSTELFIFAFIIIFSFTAAKFQMSNKVFLALLAISALMFSEILRQEIYVLIILIVGIVSFKGIAKIFN